jgi:hypothetical protein
MLPHLNGMLGHGIQVMVREVDYEKAKELLDRKEHDEKILKCPNCGSSNIGFGVRGKRRMKDLLLIFLSLVFTIPMGNIKNKYYCKDCQETFV